MTQKKNNSGGRKFQERLPEEKRVRVSNKKEGRSSKPRPGATDKKRDEKGGRGGEFDKPRKYSSDKREAPRGEKRTGAYGKKPADNRRGGEVENKRSSGPGYRKTGATRNTSFREGPKKYGQGKPESDRGSRGGKFRDAKPGEKESRFTERKPWDKKKTTGEKRDWKDKSRTPRPESRGFEKPRNFKGGRKNYNKNSDNLVTAQSLVEEDVRLNRYIANSGLCSRREADVMIAQGLVSINGVVVETLGTKVKKGDDVRVDGKRINPEKPIYILLNKPKGYITSTSDPNERATVMDLIDLPGKERIYPVGRLDRNTTGVLLLTNDGELAQKLMHPSFEIKKIYKAALDRKPSKDHLLAWVNGVELEDGFMSFEQIGYVDEDDNTVLGLEVHSGRNRIVRRMFEHFEYEVKSLDRVMLGEFDHMKLGRGKWRFLNDKEIRYVEKLKRMRGKKPS